MVLPENADHALAELEALFAADLRKRVVERAVEMFLLSSDGCRTQRYGELLAICAEVSPRASLLVALVGLSGRMKDHPRPLLHRLLQVAADQGDEVTSAYAKCAMGFPLADVAEVEQAATALIVSLTLGQEEPWAAVADRFGGTSRHKVVPSDPDRVKKVREVLRRKFRLSLSAANALTASLYGFELYDDLRDAIYEQSDEAALLEDEFCSGRVVGHRRAAQAQVLARHVRIEQAFAADIIDLVRPTSRDWPPSLQSLNPFRR